MQSLSLFLILYASNCFQPAATPTSGADVSPEANTEFWHGFIGAISVIIVSELGDKTFFIAAILAMRHSRLVVFGGAIAALSIMTVLSGKRAFTILPGYYDMRISSLSRAALSVPKSHFH